MGTIFGLTSFFYVDCRLHFKGNVCLKEVANGLREQSKVQTKCSVILEDMLLDCCVSSHVHVAIVLGGCIKPVVILEGCHLPQAG